MVIQIPPPPDTQVQGLALICSLDGEVREILRDDYAMLSLADASVLLDLVDQFSVHKLENFLAELRSQSSSFGWEINAFYEGQLAPLHFAGGRADDRILVLAAKSRSDVYALFNELIHIQNDFVDSIREIIVTQAQLAQDHIDRDNRYFEELTRLTNELATLQRQLAKQNIELEQLNQTKNRFLGMAAHDLRGPLAAIMSYSEFLIEETRTTLNDEHQYFLAIIHSSSSFMSQLVEDLLDVSNIESGKLHLDRQLIDIVALVGERVALYQMLAQSKGLNLNYVKEIETLWLDVDASKIGQVVDNLIGNAIKYSQISGNIAVSISADAHHVVLTVKDEGVGIPSEEISKLFQFFSRTSVRSPHGEKSTGLGLAIAKRIIQGHGGKIWVKSTVGTGSTFFVQIPIGNRL